MYQVHIDWRRRGSLSSPEADDGYLFENDERNHSSTYRYEDGWEEDEAVESDFCK